MEKKEMELGGFKIVAEMDGLILRLNVLKGNGDEVENLLTEFNEGRGFSFTLDEDLLNLDYDRYDDLEEWNAYWAGYERAERDPEFRRNAALREKDLSTWRQRKAELETRARQDEQFAKMNGLHWMYQPKKVNR